MSLNALWVPNILMNLPKAQEPSASCRQQLLVQDRWPEGWSSGSEQEATASGLATSGSHTIRSVYSWRSQPPTAPEIHRGLQKSTLNSNRLGSDIRAREQVTTAFKWSHPVPALLALCSSVTRRARRIHKKPLLFSHGICLARSVSVVVSRLVGPREWCTDSGPAMRRSVVLSNSRELGPWLGYTRWW